MAEDLKHIIKSEFIKCAKDPIYFMKKYYTIQHPQRGRIKFNPLSISRESSYSHE